jgi:hypothetical protein
MCSRSNVGRSPSFERLGLAILSPPKGNLICFCLLSHHAHFLTESASLPPASSAHRLIMACAVSFPVHALELDNAPSTACRRMETSTGLLTASMSTCRCSQLSLCCQIYFFTSDFLPSSMDEDLHQLFPNVPADPPMLPKIHGENEERRYHMWCRAYIRLLQARQLAWGLSHKPFGLNHKPMVNIRNFSFSINDTFTCHMWCKAYIRLLQARQLA